MKRVRLKRSEWRIGTVLAMGMIRHVISVILFVLWALTPEVSLATTQQVPPTSVAWTFHHGDGHSDNYLTALIGCQTAVTSDGGSGAYLDWGYSAFDGENLSHCLGYKGTALYDYGYIYPIGTCPSGSTGPDTIRKGVASCQASCAYGLAYNSLGGTCTPTIDKNFYQPCPVCFGDPIYPLNGAKRQAVDLGLSIGGQSITIAYDSTPLVPQNDYNVPFEVVTPASFGSLWQTNLHKTLVLQPSTTSPSSQVGSPFSAVVMQRGSALLETASVPGSSDCSSAGSGGNNYVPTVNRSEQLILSGTGSAGMVIDQRALTEEVYDSIGAISSMARVSGGRLTYTYTAGMLTAITDQFGRMVQFGYEQPSDITLPQRINLITAVDGTQIHAVYTSTNMLSALIWADSNIETFVYDSSVSAQLLTGIVDENNVRYSTTTYDSSGLAQSTFEGSGINKYSVTYTTPPSWQVITTALNASYMCREHRFGAPTGTVMALPNGQTSTIDAMAINGAVYLSSISQSAGSGSATATGSRAYDGVGNITTEDDFNGDRACYAYDTSRNLQIVVLEGLSAAKTCPATLTNYAPSAADASHPERKTTTVWHPDWVLKAQEAEPKKMTTWVYNGQPDPIGGGTASCAPSTATLPDGKPIAVLCIRYEQATTDATGALGVAATVTGATRQWSYTYNQYGQVLTETTPKLSVTDTLSHTTTYVYYGDTSLSGGVGHTLGDLNTVTNPLGQTTTYTSYDAAGRLLSSTDANGTVTTQTYWPRGWLKSQTVTPASGGGAAQTTAYAYWPTGLLQTVTLPDSSTLSYAYDDAHRLTDVTDGAGNKLHYTLDNSGNRTNEQVSDASGVLASNVTRVFDNLNRVQSTTGAVH